MNFMDDIEIIDDKHILLLVDLKENESLESLNDVQLLRTIGAFKSSFNCDINVIPISNLPHYAQTHSIHINDIYLIGHGSTSRLGSGLTLEECGKNFNEALSNPNFYVDHIHLTVCHSADSDITMGNGKSLLLLMHENLKQIPNKSVQITGYKNEIHLVQDKVIKRTGGHIELRTDMPYASIIHHGLQPLVNLEGSEGLTGSIFNDLMSFSQFCQNGSTPEKTGPIFAILNDFVTTLNTTGYDGQFYKKAEANYSLLADFNKTLNKFIEKNKITLDERIELKDEYKKLDLKSLRKMFKQLTANKNEIDTESIKQIYLAFQTMKNNMNFDEGKNFVDMRKNLFQNMKNHFNPIPDNEQKIGSLCGEIITFAEKIYFDNSAMDYMEKINFIRYLDKYSIEAFTDTLNVNNYYLIDPKYTYTCQSDKDFPEFSFFDPTVCWEKGIWKEVLCNLKFFDAKGVEDSLKYICDAIDDFKKTNNINAIKEIFTVMPNILFDTSNSWKNDYNRLTHMLTIFNLLNQNKEIIQQLDKETLAEWKQFLDNTTGLSGYRDFPRQNALAFINNCLAPEETLNNTSKNNTSYMISILAKQNNIDVNTLTIEKDSSIDDDKKVTNEQPKKQTNGEAPSIQNSQPTTNQTPETNPQTPTDNRRNNSMT